MANRAPVIIPDADLLGSQVAQAKAASAIAVASANMFETTAAGIAGTSSGDYFSTEGNGTTILANLWRNVSGVAVTKGVVTNNGNMQGANNLSEITSAATARANLGINLALYAPLAAPSFTGHVQSAGLSSLSGARITGQQLSGASGGGIELLFDGSTGNIQGYDRTAGAYITLNHDALSINFRASGSTKLSVTSAGVAVTGVLTKDGVNVKTDSMATARILGRTTAGAGAIEEISIGNGLALASGVLSASGGIDLFDPSRTFRAAYGRCNSTSTFDMGIALTATGTNNLVTLVNNSLLRSLPRSQRSTGTAAEAYAGWRDPDNPVYRRNGFKVAIIGGVNTIAGADSRFFMGLTSDNLLNTDEDTLDFDNIFAFAMDAADNNWQLMHNNGATGATKNDTSIALAADELIAVVFECEPAGSSITGTIYRWTGTSRTVASTYSQTISTNLPSATLALYPYWWAGNNGAAAATIIDLVAMKAWV